MSFRKRGEIINASSVSRGPVPIRAAPGNARISSASAISGRLPPRSPLNRVRGPTNIPERNRVPPAREIANLSIQDDIEPSAGIDSSHPGIRPSPATSQQTTSTGCYDLDKVLGHTGLPLGTSLLIEEESTTEFNSVLAKLFAAQGVVHNRIPIDAFKSSGNTHLVILSSNQLFGRELPGVYKGSKKDVKKAKISEEESKVTVQNLAEKAKPTRYEDLKIAWRYKLGEDLGQKKASTEASIQDSHHKDYNHQFDITTRLLPAPTSAEISFISPVQPLSTILMQVEQVISKHRGKLVRILVPSMLHPALYPPKTFKLSFIIGLLHGLRSITKKYEERCILLATASIDMLDSLTIKQMENMFDSVLVLEPFKQDMLQFLERIYKSQPNKVQHGLLHIQKLPVFSEKGEMRAAVSEWVFRNGRKKFEIEEWSIPVDDADNNNSATKTVEILEGGKAGETSGAQSKVSLDF